MSTSDDHLAAMPRGTGLGVVAALPGEARALARLRPLGQTRLRGGGQLRLSGIGAIRARQAAMALVDQGATALLSWGTSGALAPYLDPGAIILASSVVNADGRTRASDHAWREALACELATHHAVYEGAIAESRDIVADPMGKQRLYETSGAIACDMESAAIAEVAAEHGIRFMALRAIIDDANMTLPPVALAAMDADGHLRPGGLLSAIASEPRRLHAQLRSLKQLAVAFRAARNSLGDAARLIVDGEHE